MTNETIKDLIGQIRARNQGMPIDCESVDPLVEDWLSFADRLEAAHKRELAAKDEELREVKRKLATSVESHAKLIQRNEAIKWKVENYAQVVEAKDAEIVKRNALIKQLADALNLFIPRECIACGKMCNKRKMCNHQKNYRALIAKAREVCK